MSKVRIAFKKGGKTEVKVEGVPGGRCAEASAPYETVIGGKQLSRENTDEAYMDDIDVQDQIELGEDE